jgi:hypothetical protein
MMTGRGVGPAHPKEMITGNTAIPSRVTDAANCFCNKWATDVMAKE